jgi:hypothetical protein
MMRNNPLRPPDLRSLGFYEPDAIRQMRELAQTALNPYREHQQMMRNLLEPYHRARELGKRY